MICYNLPKRLGFARAIIERMTGVINNISGTIPERLATGVIRQTHSDDA
jgi:hypothetical protein